MRNYKIQKSVAAWKISKKVIYISHHIANYTYVENLSYWTKYIIISNVYILIIALIYRWYINMFQWSK